MALVNSYHLINSYHGVCIPICNVGSHQVTIVQGDQPDGFLLAQPELVLEPGDLATFFYDHFRERHVHSLAWGVS